MRLIDADALEKDANDDLYKYPYRVDEFYWNDGAKSIIDLIKTAPTIDPVKLGRWVADETTVRCSECAQTYWGRLASPWKYCPNCGAKVEEKDGRTENP